MNFNNHWASRYGMAVVGALLAWALRLALANTIGEDALYLTVAPVIVIVAVLFGLGPGLLTSLISLFLIEDSLENHAVTFTYGVSAAIRSMLLLIVTYAAAVIGTRMREATARANAQARTAREAQAALSLSESKYRRLFENMQECVALYAVERDQDGRIIDHRVQECNDAYLRSAGAASVEQVRAKDPAGIFGDPPDETYLEALRKAMDTGDALELEMYVPRTDSHYINTIVPLDADTYLGTARDITERIRAEEARRESETKYQDLVQSVDCAVILWKPDGTVSFSNDYVESFLGYSPEEIIGRHVSEILPEGDYAGRKFRALPEEIVRHPERYVHHTHENLRSDGSRVWMVWTNKPVFDARGRLTEILSLGIDINARKLAEEALHANEQALRTANNLLEAITESSKVVIAAVDNEFRYTYFNRVYQQDIERLTGRNISLGMNMLDVTNAVSEERGLVNTLWTRALNGETLVRTLAFGSGTHRTWIKTQHAPIRDADGEIIGAGEVTTDVTELMQAQEALWQSESRYHALVDLAPDTVLVLQGDTIVFANQAALGLYEAESPRQLVGLPVLDFIHPGDQEKLRSCLDAALRGSPSRFSEIRTIGLNARTVWVEGAMAPVNFGLEPAVQLMLHDVTERRHYEQILEETTERLEMVHWAAGAGIWDWDVVTGHLDWSPHMFDLLGLDPRKDSPSLEVWEKSLYPDDAGSARRTLAERLRDNTIPTNEYRVLLPDGQIRWISSLGRATYDPDGRPIRMMGICIDITERRQVQEALARQREELQTLLDSVSTLICYKDRNNRFLRVNRAFAESMGLPKEQIEGRSVFDLFPREQADAFWRDDLEVLEKGEAKINYIEPARLNGQDRWVQTSKVPYRDVEGRAIGIILSSVDVTDRKRAEESLEILSRFPGENPYPVLRVSSDKTLLYCNPAGYPLLREWQCQPGDHVPSSIAIRIDDVLKTGKTSEIEAQVGERIYSLVFTPILAAGYANIYGRDITEAKRAAEAIRKSENQLRQAMRLNRSFTFQWNVLANEVVRSEECAEILGLSGESALRDTKESYFSRVHPEDREQFQTLIEELSPENDTYSATYRFLHPDGMTVTLEEIARGTFDENGSLLSLQGMTADVTVRKQSEEAISRHNAVLEGINTILNAALTAGTEHDVGSVCLDVAERTTQSKMGFIGMINERGLQDIAISDAAWGACTVTDHTGHARAPGDLRLHGIYGKVFDNGRGLFTNDPPRHPDHVGLPEGHPELRCFLGVPLVHEGKTIGMVAVANREGGYSRLQQESLETLAPAIVEAFIRRRTDEALRHSREDLAEAQSVGQVGSWRLDVATNLLTWSEEAYRIFGVPLGTPLTYDTFLNSTHPDDREYVDRQWQAALNGAPYDIEHRIVADGTIKWVREKAQLEFDDECNVVGGFGITQDITIRRETEEALLRSRDRFALLADTMGALLVSDNPQSLVESLCTRVMEHLDCHVFFNFIADPREGRLHLNAYAGIPENQAADLKWLNYGVAVCGCAAAEASRIVAERIPTTPDPRTDLVRTFGVKAYACHPLLGPDRKVIGTLSFGTRNRETFNEDDLALMKSVADHVAVAMERVNSEQALRAAYDELEHRVNVRTEELRRASLYARSLIEASLDPLVTISLTGEITDVNQATEQATGIPRSELIGSDFSGYFTEPEKARAGYQHALEEGRVRDYPLTIRHTSGTTMDVLYNAVIYRNEAGLIQGVFAAARDVTERKKAEDALRNSEALLAQAQRTAHLGGWEWNLLTDTHTWSDEMYRIFGLAPQSVPVTSELFLQFIHEDDRDLVRSFMEQAHQNNGAFEFDYRIVRPDAQERIVHAQGELIFDGDELPVGVRGTVLDVTEQVRAQQEAQARQQQLIQADKMVSLGILVAGVAHEINNPNHLIMSNITALSGVWDSVVPILDQFREGFGDFVLGGYDYSESRDKLPEMFSIALSSSRRIESIVTELRDFARYNPSEKMTPVDLNAVLKSAVVLISSMLEKATDRFSIEYAAELPPVLGNFQRIEQVLLNLIQNACRALPSRDKGIFLATSYLPDARAVQIEVRDEGIGIREEDMKHLGDPFYTTSRSMGGTGLGLWVSYNIVHEHGGTLTFHSKQGEGSRALLVFPVYRDSDEPGIVELSVEEEV